MNFQNEIKKKNIQIVQPQFVQQEKKEKKFNNLIYLKQKFPKLASEVESFLQLPSYKRSFQQLLKINGFFAQIIFFKNITQNYCQNSKNLILKNLCIEESKETKLYIPQSDQSILIYNGILIILRENTQFDQKIQKLQTLQQCKQQCQDLKERKNTLSTTKNQTTATGKFSNFLQIQPLQNNSCKHQFSQQNNQSISRKYEIKSCTHLVENDQFFSPFDFINEKIKNLNSLYNTHMLNENMSLEQIHEFIENNFPMLEIKQILFSNDYFSHCNEERKDHKMIKNLNLYIISGDAKLVYISKDDLIQALTQNIYSNKLEQIIDLQKIWIFKPFSNAFILKNILDLVQKKNISNGKIIFKQGDIDNQKIYFVCKGQIELFINYQNKQNKELNNLSRIYAIEKLGNKIINKTTLHKINEEEINKQLRVALLSQGSIFGYEDENYFDKNGEDSNQYGEKKRKMTAYILSDDVDIYEMNYIKFKEFLELNNLTKNFEENIQSISKQRRKIVSQFFKSIRLTKLQKLIKNKQQKVSFNKYYQQPPYISQNYNDFDGELMIHKIKNKNMEKQNQSEQKIFEQNIKPQINVEVDINDSYLENQELLEMITSKQQYSINQKESYAQKRKKIQQQIEKQNLIRYLKTNISDIKDQPKLTTKEKRKFVKQMKNDKNLFPREKSVKEHLLIRILKKKYQQLQQQENLRNHYNSYIQYGKNIILSQSQNSQQKLYYQQKYDLPHITNLKTQVKNEPKVLNSIEIRRQCITERDNYYKDLDERTNKQQLQSIKNLDERTNKQQLQSIQNSKIKINKLFPQQNFIFEQKQVLKKQNYSRFNNTPYLQIYF